MRLTRIKTVGAMAGVSAVAALLLPLPAWAAIDDVDALVESVRQEALKEAAYDEERINRFLAAQAEQQELLRDARAQLAAVPSKCSTATRISSGPNTKKTS